MIKFIKLSLAVLILSLLFTNLLSTSRAMAADCTLTKSGPLGIPTWYKYLEGETADNVKLGTETVTICKPKLYTVTSDEINSDPSKAGNTLSKNVTAIGLAIIEIVMRLLIYISFIWGIWGGYKILTSGGNSQGFKSGVETIKNALVGLVIGLLSTSIIVFAGSKLTA